MSIELKDNYTVKYLLEEIRLLPKEYSLFKFLYNNKNQVFSRESILNAVWTTTDPNDRTVDEHIRRLRKNLKKWDFISINTIRNIGYQLTITDRSSMNPLSQDKDFQSASDQIFRKYISYGQAKGLRTLVQTQESLGIEQELKKEIYILFVEGKFQRIIDDNDIPFWEKAFYLLHIFSLIQFDVKQTYEYYQILINHNKLDLHYRKELQRFGIITPLIFLNNYDLAQRTILETKALFNVSKNQHLELYLKINELMLYLATNNKEKVFSLLDKLDSSFSQNSFNREYGRYNIIKGIALLFYGKEDSNAFIDKGLHVLRDAEYVPSYIQGVHNILTFCKMNGMNKLESYVQLWNNLEVQYHFIELQKKIKKVFDHNI